MAPGSYVDQGEDLRENIILKSMLHEAPAPKGLESILRTRGDPVSTRQALVSVPHELGPLWKVPLSEYEQQ